jgi:hypothetical protein
MNANFRSRARPVGDARRDGMVALILALFSAAWFSWGQPDASGALTTALASGSCVALAVAVWGACRFFSAPRGDGAPRDPAVGRRYGIIVAIEFAAIGLGAAVLGASGASAYIPVWACGVVGLHFVALASLFRMPALRALGAVVSAVAVAGLLVGVSSDANPAGVSGLGAGLALVVYATLLLAGRAQPRPA